MKSIKTTFIRGLSLLLALVIVLNLPISAFAATDTSGDGIEPYAYSYDEKRAAMIDSPIFKALKYLKYDRYNELENNGYLFTTGYVANTLVKKYDTGNLSHYPLTDIEYNNSSGAWGTKTTKDANGNTVPDVAEFEAKGLMCTSFVEYYFLNYLRYVEKADVQYIIDEYEAAIDRINAGKQNYGIDAWYEAAETIVAKDMGYSYSFSMNDSIAPDEGETETEAHKKYMAMFNTLPIGSLIRFGYPGYGKYNDQFRHFAIYAGTYNNVHYMIHIGNDRGPEISIVEYMASADGNKASYPLEFYVFGERQQFGSVGVAKVDPDGKPLANNAPSDWVDEAFKRVEADLSKQDIARVAEHYSHYFDNGGMRDDDIKAIAAQMREYINSGVDPDDAFARATNEHENEKLIDQAVHMIRYEVGQGHSASRVRAMLSDPNQCVYGDPLPAEVFDEAYKRFETENANTIAVEPPAPEPIPEPEFELE